MKIGIITFHWAVNYGAALQAYALTKHLKQSGHEAEVIDYLPRRIMLKLRFFDWYLRRFSNIRRSSKFRRFRKHHLQVSTKTYCSRRALNRVQNTYDAVIAGSDQIWNESFLMTAEKTPTLSYYLDFLPKNVLRLSYAASFGTNTLSDNLKQLAVPCLKEFDAVSVREENAVDMLAKENIKAVSVCDPTLLIEPEDYAGIIKDCKNSNKVDLFNFMLRRGRSSTDDTEAYIISHPFRGKTNLGKGILPVDQWLWKLKNCSFVVTDSFHCTVFAILFHKPFLAVNDKDCPMNARIKTLTHRLGLEHRVVDAFDPDKINVILEDTSFDWDAVDEKRRQWATESASFLRDRLHC